MEKISGIYSILLKIESREIQKPPDGILSFVYSTIILTASYTNDQGKIVVDKDSRRPLEAATSLDESKPYSHHVPAYFRMDIRFALRTDNNKTSSTLALAIQNLLGIKNTDALIYDYNPDTHQWEYNKLSGFVPVISYQVNF